MHEPEKMMCPDVSSKHCCHWSLSQAVSADVLVAGRNSINAGGRFKCSALDLHTVLMPSETSSSAVVSVCS